MCAMVDFLELLGHLNQHQVKPWWSPRSIDFLKHRYFEISTHFSLERVVIFSHVGKLKLSIKSYQILRLLVEFSLDKKINTTIRHELYLH